MLEQHPNAQVISTGYRTNTDDQPLNINELGVILDQAARTATARYLPAGVYYPEPNTFFRIQDNKPNLGSSFEKTNSSNKKEHQYDTPNESMVFVHNLLKNRGLQNSAVNSSQGNMIYDASHGSVVTTLPRRMQLNIQNPQFENNRLQIWGKDTLTALLGQAQSHAGSRNWAGSVARGLIFANAYNPDVLGNNQQKLSSSQMQKKISGVLTYLFNACHPVHMAIALSEQNGRPFNKCLLEVIKYYKYYLQQNQAAINACVKTLTTLLRDNDEALAKNILKAALAAGTAIGQELKQHLRFEKLEQMQSRNEKAKTEHETNEQQDQTKKHKTTYSTCRPAESSNFRNEDDDDDEDNTYTNMIKLNYNSEPAEQFSASIKKTEASAVMEREEVEVESTADYSWRRR